MHGVGTLHEAFNLIFNFNSETESSRHFIRIIFFNSGPFGDINSLGRERDLTYSLLINQ